MTLSKSNLVLAIFFINAIVAITSAFVFMGGVHTGLIRAGFIAVALPLLIINIKFTKATAIIFLVLIYLSVSLLTNTRFVENIPTFIGVIFSLLMYPLAYSYIYKHEHYEKLSKIVIWLLMVFGLHFIWAQLFQVGVLPYERAGGAFYVGGGGVQQTFIIVYLLLFLPFVIKFYPKRFGWFEISALILSLFPVFLIFRRGAILAFLLGLIIYSIFHYRKSKFFKFVFIGSIIAILTFPTYYSQIQPLIERRTIDVTDTEAIEQIGRTQEIITWAPYWMETKGFTHTLFGSELYDYQQLANTRRSLHTDYAVYLIGAGIIGFILYFSVLLFIIFDFRNYVKNIKSRVLRKELTSILFALLGAYMIISYSGQYYVISALSTVMFMFGVLNRYVVEYDDE